jgi:acetyl/propionyl-CoA carboxylase alpha subunit/acetyl-CoA carboxylase carboxyltransferase component
VSELRPIRRLAIANRGEAALRCLRTVRALAAREGSGLGAVALYTAPDRSALWVRQADRAVELAAPGGPLAAHLDVAGVVAAARRGDADAIWPGWGFLAEDPAFADAVAAAGLAFLGPPGAVMRALGDKIAAKQLAERLGVPVAPWSSGSLADADAARAAADRLGYPLLLKAAAGGGGRGIRSVGGADAVGAAFASAAAEARAAFGDARLYLERRIDGGRHIEVQIAADAHGHVLALGARECSVQRRHQKLVEEAPPPGVRAALLAQLEDAALSLARAVDYRGVGTVEFLVAGADWWFLEVNPRLQVEHPVTELTSGIDLVEWQIRIARGERLPAAAPTTQGAAIEVRLCAEDPAEGFRPAPGRVVRFVPALGPGVRVDTGVAAGSVIPAEFDSLVAKVIASGVTRDVARARLAAALGETELVIAGGASNQSLLRELLDSAELRAGAVDTGWLDRRGTAQSGTVDVAPALVAAAILAYQRVRGAARARVFAALRHAPAARVPASTGQRVDLAYRGARHSLHVFAVGGWRYRVTSDGVTTTARFLEDGEHAARLELGDRRERVLYDAGETGVRVEVGGCSAFFSWDGEGQLRAAAPGVVVSLVVASGDRVERGQPIGALEAMKTELALCAPIAGTVTELRVRAGQRVGAGDLLLVVEPGDGVSDAPRIALAPERDPLDALAAADPALRAAALDALHEEIRRLLLGYDCEPERSERLLALLAAQPAAPADRELDALREALACFADVEVLFLRNAHGLGAGRRAPSNLARLRAALHAVHAGAPLDDDELVALLRRALGHYGVASFARGEELDRALLRLLACPNARALRQRWAIALVERVALLARGGAPDDDRLADALDRIAALRGRVSDGLADAALEAAAAFERDEPGLVEPKRVLAGVLPRLGEFALERLRARDGVVAFHARHQVVSDDERLFVLAEVDARASDVNHEAALLAPAFERAFHRAARALRALLLERDPERRLQWNRIFLLVNDALFLDPETAEALARRLAPDTRHLGLEKVVVRVALLDRKAPEAPARAIEIGIEEASGAQEITWRAPRSAPLRAASGVERRIAEARRRRLVHPVEIVRLLTGDSARGRFEEWDLDDAGRVAPVARPLGEHAGAIVFGVVTTASRAVPEGVRRVLVLSDPTRGMGALAAPECDRIVAAIDLAERLGLPVEWVPVSSGARIALDSGTENLDATARVARRIVTFTRGGGVIHVVVHGVNVGAQSYWNALATMLLGTKGALVMTGQGAMVLTGRAALEASGSVAAEDEIAIGGFERVMGPNGEAQYFARDLAEAFRLLQQHYEYSYVVPGERGPRRVATSDPPARSICAAPYPVADVPKDAFAAIGDLFDPRVNPDRKQPFAMRALMGAVIDTDGGHLERWSAMTGAETAIVWDARIGGFPVCLVGIESRDVPREGEPPPDGPERWNAGTLFPLASKKVARALDAASGNRPVVVLANLSGFDGSPESMRRRQLEHGAEIARAVVGFDGPLLFLVVSRYHGGAYVVFSRALNGSLRAAAIEGSFASVIGGGPAAAAVFDREIRARALADPNVAALRASGAPRDAIEAAEARALADEQARFAARFDAVHTVERALRVGSLESIVAARDVRAHLVAQLEAALA